MLHATAITGPEPLTAAEVKDMLRIDDNAFDAQLPVLIAAAREVVERQTGCALVSATYEWTPEYSRAASPLPLLPATITSAEGALPITFTTTAPAVVPPALKVAIVLLVGELVENPQADAPTNMVENPAFTRLVWPFRRMVA